MRQTLERVAVLCLENRIRGCGTETVCRHRKVSAEMAHRSLTTEYSLTSKLLGLRLFPGSAAALPSKMGSFQWKFVEYKEQNGFVFAILPRPQPVTT